MLAEERQSKILNIVNEQKATTVLELSKRLNISESTIRRDLNFLDSINKLTKVHGGATALNVIYNTSEDDVVKKSKLNIEQKSKVARYAASLIRDSDFVYIDAGTTTGLLINYVIAKDVVFVTNGINTAKDIAKLGFNVNIISGRVKSKTEAVIGNDAIKCIEKYNFTVGFFGTNGIDVRCGFTTPDIDEARIKTEAISKCREKYILTDNNKFNKISSVTFAKITDAKIITTRCIDAFIKSQAYITEVDLL